MIFDTQENWKAMWACLNLKGELGVYQSDKEVEEMFYARHRRAVLTTARFAGMDLAFTNACLCWV
jgi:hypothetical protein